jgi:hypothetical protein
MSMNNPAGTPATGASGQEPGATSQPQSQGPNDPIQPPATGGGQQPATGAAAGQQDDEATRQQRNRDEALARMARDRDEARRQLDEERRKNLPPEEVQRLRALDDALKAQKDREKGLILRYEIASRAPKLGIIDPEIAVVLLERNPSITVDDAGSVSGLDEALKALIKDKPHLVRAVGPADAGAGTGGARPGGSKVTMNDIIRRGVRGQNITNE